MSPCIHSSKLPVPVIIERGSDAEKTVLHVFTYYYERSTVNPCHKLPIIASLMVSNTPISTQIPGVVHRDTRSSIDVIGDG